MYRIDLIVSQTKETLTLHSGDQYYSSFLLDLELAEDKDRLAQTVKIELANLGTDRGLLYYITNVFDQIVIYANFFNQTQQVFQGFIWQKDYKSSDTKIITLTCFDELVYLNQSEDLIVFPEKVSSQSALQTVCNRWEIPLDYRYVSCDLSELKLRGVIGNFILNDILDETANQTGVDYSIRSESAVMVVKPVGSNNPVYELHFQQNGTVLDTSSSIDLSKLITKVAITASGKDEGIEYVVEGNTQFGTLQKLLSRKSESTLEEAQAEADKLLRDQGKPARKFTLNALDNPFIHKGDKVKVVAGDMTQEYIVESITHKFSRSGEANMCLEMVEYGQ